MVYEDRVTNKCSALLNLILGIREFYKQTNYDNKKFIETTIGAAIWYLPKNNEILFTGKISKEAILKGEKSEDHLYPRKIAASKLLIHKWEDEVDPVKTLSNLFMTKYGRYNYVSKSENKRLIKFQKSEVFETPQKAYDDAGIELVSYEKEWYL
jgi:hypothetical protein